MFIETAKKYECPQANISYLSNILVGGGAEYMHHISSSNLNKNISDDQKIFNLCGFFWIEYSRLFKATGTNKPRFYLTDCLNVSDMDLNPFLMLIWGC